MSEYIEKSGNQSIDDVMYPGHIQQCNGKNVCFNQRAYTCTCNILSISYMYTVDSTYNEYFYKEIQGVIKISHLISHCVVLVNESAQWLIRCEILIALNFLVKGFVLSGIHIVQFVLVLLYFPYNIQCKTIIWRIYTYGAYSCIIALSCAHVFFDIIM